MSRRINVYERWNIDPEVLAEAETKDRKGEWVSLHNGKWKCSECGIEVLIYAKGNYCPNCGADMRGADDERR